VGVRQERLYLLPWGDRCVREAMRTTALVGAAWVVLIWLSAGWSREQQPGAGAYAHAFVLWAGWSLAICIGGLAAGRAPPAVDGLAVVNERE
jgi:hypothetical protein